MSNKFTSSDFDLALNAYLDYIKGQYDAGGHSRSVPRTMSVKNGQKFAKLIIHGSTQRSVHSFVVLQDFTAGKSAGGKSFKQGDILMSAGWNAPALNHARGNILDLEYGDTSAYGAGYIRGHGAPNLALSI